MCRFSAFGRCCFTPPLASYVVVVRMSSYLMSALHKSSTFTTFATKFAAACAATSIPYASPTFAMTYSIRPRSSQAASFGSTLPCTSTYPAWLQCSVHCLHTFHSWYKWFVRQILSAWDSSNHHAATTVAGLTRSATSAPSDQRQHCMTCAPWFWCTLAHTFVTPIRCTISTATTSIRWPFSATFARPFASGR